MKGQLRGSIDGIEFDLERLSEPGHEFPTHHDSRPVSRVEGPPDDSCGAPPTTGWRLLTIEGSASAPVPMYAAPASDDSDGWWVLYLVLHNREWRGVVGWPTHVSPIEGEPAELLVIEWPKAEISVSSGKELIKQGVLVRRRDREPLTRDFITHTHVIARLFAIDGSEAPEVLPHQVLPGPGPVLELDDSGGGLLPVLWAVDVDTLRSGAYEATAQLVRYNVATPKVRVVIGQT